MSNDNDIGTCPYNNWERARRPCRLWFLLIRIMKTIRTMLVSKKSCLFSYLGFFKFTALLAHC